jgi:hypothetical protein
MPIFRYQNMVLILPKDMENVGQVKQYFQKTSNQMWVFLFSLGYKNEKILIKKYVQGKKVFSSEQGKFIPKNLLFKYFAYYFIFLNFVFQHLKRKEQWIIITQFPLFCIGNKILSQTKNLKYVYWIHDHFLADSLLMKIFNTLVSLYNKRLPHVLYLSARLNKIYNQHPGKHQHRDLVPLGIAPLATKFPHTQTKIITLGFIGIIRKMQGLDLVFELLKHHAHYRLEIIGEGYDFDYYQKLSQRNNINHQIIWHKTVVDPQKINFITRRWDIGLAPYEGNKKNYTYYGDPAKIKIYFSYGLPVITTKLVNIEDDIKKLQAGEVIDYNYQAISIAIMQIINNYSQYLAGVKKIVQKYDYQQLYSQKFRFLEKS